MKKFLIGLVVLLILGGVVFYFGWIQFLIPDDGYGVVFSRTHGWESEAIRPGEFQWRWQRLIPTNMEVYVFDSEPRTVQVDASGSLPSGEIYRTVLADRPDLSYEISAAMTIAIEPETLPELADEEGLRPDNLDRWYERTIDTLKTAGVDRLIDLLSDGDAADALSIESIEEELVDYLSGRHPRLRIKQVALRSYRVPDFALYQEARSLYRTQLEAETDALIAASAERADRQARDEEIQRSLRSYGEVLDEYPILLEYFQLGVDPFQFQRLFEE